MGKKAKCPHCKEVIDMEDLEMVEDTRPMVGGAVEKANTKIL